MIQVVRIDFDEDYFLKETLPKARALYFEKFLPKLRDDAQKKLAARGLWDSVFVEPGDMPPKLLENWYAVLETWDDGGKMLGLKDTSGGGPPTSRASS